MNNFWQRAITGAIFVVVLVGAIVLGPRYYVAVFGLIVVMGLWEFYTLFNNSDSRPDKILGTLLGSLIFVSFSIQNYIPKFQAEIFGAIIFLLSLLLLATKALFSSDNKPFESISLTVTGIIYVVFPFLLLISLSEGPCIIWDIKSAHFWPILTIFILIWANDTFAYITGRLFGKHKLFERISPKKTWEGFIGGIVFAVGAGILIAYFLDWSYTKMITYGLVVGIVGTIGDLVESMLKRSVGVKDSGNILPGHGGILDRFDALLFVVPVIFIIEKTFFS